MRVAAAPCVIATAFAALCAIAAASTARADETYPMVVGEVSIEVENDLTFQSDDPDAELNDLFATIEPGFGVYATPELSLWAGLVLEPVLDPDPGQDRVFDDHGLYVETLSLGYETDRFLVYGGKINPPFGIAWDIAPGVFGTDFAGDYELTERIGLGGGVRFATEKVGEHTLSASTFFLDTTFLSESAFTDRGRTRRADGGVSNTEDLSSFTVALDGGGIAALPDVGYHIALSRQEAGIADPHDEFGIAIALYGSFEVSDETVIEPIIEHVRQDHDEGGEHDVTYLTIGSAVLHGPWNVAVSWSRRDTEIDGADNVEDTLFQISAGYAFDFGLSLDVGYKTVEEAEVDSETFGVLLAYVFEI